MRTLLTLILMLSSWAMADDHLIKDTSVPVRTRGVSEAMNRLVDEVIEQQLDLSGDTEPSAALADDLAFFVRRHYLDQGFKLVTVSWFLEDKAMIVIVDEGAQGTVGEVTFEGNPGLDVKELRRYLLRPTRDRVGRFAKDTPLCGEGGQGRTGFGASLCALAGAIRMRRWTIRWRRMLRMEPWR